MVTIINDYFFNTGWNPKCYSVNVKPTSKIHYLLKSRQDPYDRFVSLIANGVEVLRAFTPFDSAIEQTVDIPEDLGMAFALGNKVCGIVTTYVYQGWDYFAESLNEIQSNVLPIGVFAVASIDSKNRTLEANLSQSVFAKRGYLYATGHGREEGARGREFTIYADGKVVFHQYLDWGWYPGCGYVKPYAFNVNSNVKNVKVECSNCGDYWKVSLTLIAEPSGGGGLPLWLISLLGFVGGFSTVYFIRYKSKKK